MKFQDALQKLNEGRCKEIRNGDCFYKLASLTKVVINSSTLTPIALSPENFLSEDWQLVNTKPQYEEVEVVVWYDPKLNKFYDVDVTAQRSGLVKLTGTFKREIKPKVKQRLCVGKARHFIGNMLNIQYDADVYAEWEE